MTDIINWGIIGAGKIAGTFAEAVDLLPDARIAAVSARSIDKVNDFADEYNIPGRYIDAEALAADPFVQAVYVSTPNNLHKEHTLTALAQDKPVLCEKPFALNAADAAEMIWFARQKNLFLMEAMWTRYLPAIVKVREILASGVLGDIIMIQADFGFPAAFKPEGRLFNPALGGGAMLDIGIYPLSLCSMIMGGQQPEAIATLAHLGETGVDEQSGSVFRYASGTIAVIHSTIRAHTAVEAVISGTAGKLLLHNRFHETERLTLSLNGQPDEFFDLPSDGNGFPHQITEAMACIRDGKTESAIMPLDETLRIMETMDALRKEWGLVYPGE